MDRTPKDHEEPLRDFISHLEECEDCQSTVQELEDTLTKRVLFYNETLKAIGQPEIDEEALHKIVKTMSLLRGYEMKDELKQLDMIKKISRLTGGITTSDMREKENPEPKIPTYLRGMD